MQRLNRQSRQKWPKRVVYKRERNGETAQRLTLVCRHVLVLYRRRDIQTARCPFCAPGEMELYESQTTQRYRLFRQSSICETAMGMADLLRRSAQRHRKPRLEALESRFKTSRADSDSHVGQGISR